MVKEGSVKLQVFKFLEGLSIVPDHREPARQYPKLVPFLSLHCHTLVPPLHFIFHQLDPSIQINLTHAFQAVSSSVATLG